MYTWNFPHITLKTAAGSMFVAADIVKASNIICRCLLFPYQTAFAWRRGPLLVSIKAEGRLCLKCDGKRAETRFRLSAKRMSPFKSTEASVQSTTGSRGVRISSSNDGYTMFWGSGKSTGYRLHSPVSPSLPLPCLTVCHHISTGLYNSFIHQRLHILPGSITVHHIRT
jgi:hypothetical protein